MFSASWRDPSKSSRDSVMCSRLGFGFLTVPTMHLLAFCVHVCTSAANCCTSCYSPTFLLHLLLFCSHTLQYRSVFSNLCYIQTTHHPWHYCHRLRAPCQKRTSHIICAMLHVGRVLLCSRHCHFISLYPVTSKQTLSQGLVTWSDKCPTASVWVMHSHT